MSQTTYQVILSTDGKHTVIATSDDPATARDALAWARSSYELLVKTYGRKGEQTHRNGDTAEPEVVPTCAIHGVPMVKANGKYGQFWSCHERNESGASVATDQTGSNCGGQIDRAPLTQGAFGQTQAL